MKYRKAMRADSRQGGAFAYWSYWHWRADCPGWPRESYKAQPQPEGPRCPTCLDLDHAGTSNSP